MAAQQQDFQGKVAFVTGGATGIGRATSQLFARRGAAVAIADVDDRAQETVDLITAEGGRAIFIRTDVTDKQEVDAAVKTTIDTFGGLHVAFNNAGILPRAAKFADLAEDTFDKVLEVDVKGVFLAMQAELRHFIPQGGGVIVNTASVAGLIADPDMGPYVTAKHAVVGMTKSAALDHGPDGVRINAIAPALVDTPMTAEWKKQPEVWDAIVGTNFFKRPAAPEEIAEFAVFLASDAASFSTGQTYPVDAGHTAH